MPIRYPRRGSIYYADLDPGLGHEQGGRRPTLVIQNDVGNQHSPVVIVAAITSAPPRIERPTDVKLPSGSGGLEADSRVLLNQIRTLDKRRLARHIGDLDGDQMAAVDRAIQISLGLVSLAQHEDEDIPRL